MDLPSELVLHRLAPIFKYRYDDLSHFLTDRRYAYTIYKHLTQLSLGSSELSPLFLFSKLTILTLDLRAQLNLSKLRTVTELTLHGKSHLRSVFAPGPKRHDACILKLPAKLIKLDLVDVFSMETHIMYGTPIEVIRARELIWIDGNARRLPNTITHIDAPNVILSVNKAEPDYLTWSVAGEVASKLKHIDVRRMEGFSKCPALTYLDVHHEVKLTEFNPNMTHLGTIIYDKQELPSTLLSLSISCDSAPYKLPPNLTSLTSKRWYADPKMLPTSITKLVNSYYVRMNELYLYPPNLTELSCCPIHVGDRVLPSSITRLTIPDWIPSIIPETLKELVLTNHLCEVIDVTNLKHLTHFTDHSSCYRKIHLPESVIYLSLSQEARVENYPEGLLYLYSSAADLDITMLPSNVVFLILPLVEITNSAQLPQKLIYLSCFFRWASACDLPNLEYDSDVRGGTSYSMSVPEGIFRRLLEEGAFNK